MRVVLDTNVLLSAALGGRTTRPILLALVKKSFRFYSSDILLEELADVLSRSEWKRLLSANDRQELLSVVRESANIVTHNHQLSVCRDPEDNAVLECAVSGRADFLVTGDKDLLILNPFRGIHILTPREFLGHIAL